MSVRVNIRPLERLADKIRRGSGPLREVYLQWAVRYRAYAHRRFGRLSRGGGDWPPLAESTKRRRRKARRGHKGPRSFATHIDTGTLRGALDPNIENPGSLRRLLRKGVRVGYGGGARHPKAKRLTIAKLAEIHHKGLGRVPRRRIIVKPDANTVQRMKRDLNRGLRKMETWIK